MSNLDRRYISCSLTELAEQAGVDLVTFQGWFTPQDFHNMIDLGYRPWSKKLKPPVVRYIINEMIDKTLTPKTDQK